MKFELDKIKQDYEASKGFREVSKWIFGIATLGLGALYLRSTTCVIKDGEIGLRSNARGEMTLLPPGRHSNFPWEDYPCRPQSLAKTYIELERYKIITVQRGQVAQTSNHGNLEILQEGQHLIMDPSHVFNNFVSVKQETKELDQVSASTSDNVALTFKADVRYYISDPAKALGTINDIRKSVMKCAEMAITSIVGSHRLNDFAPTATNVDVQQAKGFTKLLDEIMKNLKTQLNNIGINLLNIGITSWSFDDKALAHELAQGAVIQSQTASKKLTAESDAEILKIESVAQANAITTLAAADADATKIKGEAHKHVADGFKDNPVALQAYQAAQNVEMVERASHPHLFFTANASNQTQIPVVTLPVSTATQNAAL